MHDKDGGDAVGAEVKPPVHVEPPGCPAWRLGPESGVGIHGDLPRAPMTAPTLLEPGGSRQCLGQHARWQGQRDLQLAAHPGGLSRFPPLAKEVRSSPDRGKGGGPGRRRPREVKPSGARECSAAALLRAPIFPHVGGGDAAHGADRGARLCRG